MRVLLITPPMTQLNTPYPATAYLMGCLRKHAAGAVEVAQADLSIELFLRLFSRDGLTAAAAELGAARGGKKRFDWFLSRRETYAALVEPESPEALAEALWSRSAVVAHPEWLAQFDAVRVARQFLDAVTL